MKRAHVPEEEYTCANCGNFLDEHPWIGESGRMYCKEACVERQGDSPEEDVAP